MKSPIVTMMVVLAVMTTELQAFAQQETSPALKAAKKLLPNASELIHCEDGDGDTYYNLNVFIDNKGVVKYAIVASAVGEEAQGGFEVIATELAKRVRTLSPVPVKDGSLSHFEVEKFESKNFKVTIYQAQMLGGDLSCAIESAEYDFLNRDLKNGAMDGFINRE